MRCWFRYLFPPFYVKAAAWLDLSHYDKFLISLLVVVSTNVSSSSSVLIPVWSLKNISPKPPSPYTLPGYSNLSSSSPYMLVSIPPVSPYPVFNHTPSPLPPPIFWCSLWAYPSPRPYQYSFRGIHLGIPSYSMRNYSYCSLCKLLMILQQTCMLIWRWGGVGLF